MGRSGMGFVAIVLENTTVKSLENWPTSVKVMNNCIVAHFLTHCVVIITVAYM